MRITCFQLFQEGRKQSAVRVHSVTAVKELYTLVLTELSGILIKHDTIQYFGGDFYLSEFQIAPTHAIYFHRFEKESTWRCENEFCRTESNKVLGCTVSTKNVPEVHSINTGFRMCSKKNRGS